MSRAVGARLVAASGVPSKRHAAAATAEGATTAAATAHATATTRAPAPAPPRRRKPRPAGARELLAALRPGIERETQLMPWLIADSVLGEAAGFLHADLPDEWADWLDARAERVFAGHRQFRRLISSEANGGNKGRDYLYEFMRHWLAARLARERRDLYQRLPASYALGRRLPFPTGPAPWVRNGGKRILRRGTEPDL